MNPQIKAKRRSTHRPEVLGGRQVEFIREYALCCNGREAERRVGYAPGCGMATRILNDPRAQSLLKAHTKKAAELAEIHLAWCFANIKKIAASNFHRFMKFDGSGVFLGIDLAQFTPEEAYAIQEIGFDSEGRPKVKLADKVAANRLLIEHLAPERAQRVRLEGPTGEPVEVIDGLGARLNAARRRAKQRGQSAA